MTAGFKLLPACLSSQVRMNRSSEKFQAIFILPLNLSVGSNSETPYLLPGPYYLFKQRICLTALFMELNDGQDRT